MNTRLTLQPAIARFLVADAMHVGVQTCDRHASLADVAATMAHERIHCIVVEGGSGERAEPWGIVSDLDLVAAATVRDLEEQTAGGTAATPIVLVSPAESLQRAAQLMTENAASHLIVVDPETRTPVGVLSTIDVADALTKEERR